MNPIPDPTKDMSDAKTEPELDAVRRLIIERAKAVRRTLAELSRHIRKNESYVHQFIYRGTPKKLPEDIRRTLADILEVPEESLRSPTATSGMPVPYLPGRPVPLIASATTVPVTRDIAPMARDVPVFREDDLIDLSRAEEWTYRTPNLITAGSCFALWISRSRGRLRAGDMIFVRPHQPPRAGDIVVVVSDDRRVVAVGDLVELTATDARIHDSGERATRISLAGNRTLKVSDITLP